MERDGHIRILPLHVANKIAAGEVVERLASALKELVENAIDAGADRIDISVTAGGRKLVSVRDNGCGMNRDDALLSLERQATSKIRDVDDIERIDTLGFRGEAIPSIAAVSRFTLVTRRKEDEAGTRLVVNAGTVAEVAACGAPPGTCVEVRDLFCNVPARRKFLRSYATEEGHIKSVFTISALAHPELGFSLTIDGRELHRFAPGATLEERIADLFGRDFSDELIAIRDVLGERGTGNGERGMGNGERGTGNGERGTRNGEWGTGNGRAACPQAAASSGERRVKDNAPYRDFAAFKAEYLRRLADVTDRCRKVAFEFEKVLPEVNPANLMTLSTEHALKMRRDGFANGCPRGNNSSILATGLGTAVDALLAVKEIVFEKREMSLAELGKVMAANWKGHEPLRLRMLRSKRKWGNNDPEANALGAELIDTYAAQLNGKPNSRGGVFFASGHSARQYIHLGAKTGATPDGRKAGEEMSKNLSPTMGVDTEGATALVNTLAASDVTKLPADYPLDMMLHPSVCSGEKGLRAMRALVQIFHRNGGSVIQFTVFSAEELKDAQAHPERYVNLQVRVCGWNVRWNDLSRTEQDAYIRRAESVMKGF